MTDLSDVLLAAVVTYGAPFFGLFLLLAAAGIPIPTSLLVIAAGAFIRQGFLNLPLTALLGLCGAVSGDSLSFWMGWLTGTRLERRFGDSTKWQRAREAFARRGGLAIFVTRFPLTAIAFPVSLIAGASNYQFPRFLTLSVIGEAIWIGVYGGLGYLFGSQWEVISEFVSDFSGLSVGIVILSLGIYLYLRRVRFARRQPDAERAGDTSRGPHPDNA
jgi:membrane protein DedA with SNARE-associated domain